MPILSKEEIERYEETGAAVVRNAIPTPVVDAARAAIERIVIEADPRFYVSDPARNHFYNGFMHSTAEPSIRTLLFETALPEIAARFMRAREVAFFYDQMMVKEPLGGVETPWHTDWQYFPVRGGKLLSIWIPFEPATIHTGAVGYLAGSHHWNRTMSDAQISERIAQLPAPGETVPDETFLHWDLAPGDVLVHDIFTVHGAPQNNSTSRRPALATRWMDQDVVVAQDRAAPWEDLRKLVPALPPLPPADGARMQSEHFPIVWREARSHR